MNSQAPTFKKIKSINDPILEKFGGRDALTVYIQDMGDVVNSRSWNISYLPSGYVNLSFFAKGKHILGYTIGKDEINNKSPVQTPLIREVVRRHKEVLDKLKNYLIQVELNFFDTQE